MPFAPPFPTHSQPSTTTGPDVVFDSVDENLERLSGFLASSLTDVEPIDSDCRGVEWMESEQNFVETAASPVGNLGALSGGFRTTFVLLTLGLFSLLGTVIISMDAGLRGPAHALINLVPGNDKAVHFLVFGGLVVPASLALGMHSIRLGRWHLLSGTLLLIVVSTAEEFSQICFTSRTFDLLDLSANYLGIAFFTFVVSKSHQLLCHEKPDRKRKRESSVKLGLRSASGRLLTKLR